LDAAPRHWIPLDLDALVAPDWLDPFDDPDQTVEFAVGHLPAEFQGVTVRWTFTSCHGVKPGRRLRLFFWADRPLEDRELKAWLGARLPQDGVSRRKWPQRYPVDLSIFSPAQPIYVASPIFEGMIDPVPLRSWLWRGDRDCVTPPRIGENRKVSPSVMASLGPRRKGEGYAAHRARIGDHEHGDGFFRPIKSAVASYFARHGSSVDPSWLRTDLEDAVREAPRDPAKHPDGYVEVRVRDLDPLIAAIRAFEAAAEAERQTSECEPTYPAPLATVEMARERLAEALEEHVASIGLCAAARELYRSDLKRWQEQTSMAA
jgi:hypothetical protein